MALPSASMERREAAGGVRHDCLAETLRSPHSALRRGQGARGAEVTSRHGTSLPYSLIRGGMK